MLISEIYQSRQGEGRLTGQQSVFVRTSGCNLRCGFCDTPFTSWNPEGENQTVDHLVATIEAMGPKHVVITGGEPMLQKTVVELTEKLHQLGHHITIETAGTISQPVHCDLMSISPKLSNSTPSLERAGEWRIRHERDRKRPELVKELMGRYDYQLKFVVANREDVDEVLSFLRQLGEFDAKQVLLMPEGVEQQALEERASWIQAQCDEHGFTFCPRMHIQWYGNRRGT